MNKRIVEKCYHRGCDGLAIGNSKYGQCRSCYVESVKESINRLCSDWYFEGDYDEGRRKYFEVVKQYGACSACGCRLTFWAMEVMANGTICAGSDYAPQMCEACEAYSYRVDVQIDADMSKEPVPAPTDSMVAYRIENMSGIGPFRCRPILSWPKDLLYAMQRSSRMAVPEDEDVCGSWYSFSSMEAMEYYLTKDGVAWLMSVGFRIVEVDLSIVSFVRFDRGLQVCID